MYAYIKGSLEYKHSDYLIIDANGVGYKIFTSVNTLQEIGPIGSITKVFTHFHVREDNLSLYGFSSMEELGMFELLISVSGVGPKAGLALVSSLSPSKFGLAVITDDIKSLTKAPGIGTKMAQRIILELKDKIKKEQLQLPNQSFGVDSTSLGSKDNLKASEAVSALMVLGYSGVEASRAVSAVYSDDIGLEDIIKSALKGLLR